MCEVFNNDNVIQQNYNSHIAFDLCTVTSIGDKEWVKNLLMLPRIRNQLNLSNKGGWTPTMYAAYYGHDNILLLFIQNDADVNLVNAEKQTALMLAVKCGNLKCCEILIENRAIVDAVDAQLFTALAYAVTAGYDDVTQLLIKKKANINVELGGNKMTPIMLAAIAGHEKVVRILMEAGATLNTKSWLSARSLALDKGNVKIVKMLEGCQSQAFNSDPFPKVSPKKFLDVIVPGRTVGSPMSPSQLEVPFPSDLPTLLHALGLSEYNQFFEKRNIRLHNFLQLTNESLKDLGIDKFGPRIKMSKAISRLTSGVLQSYSPVQKVSVNKQQLEIESLKQKLANSEAQLLQEQVLSRSADASDSFPTQIKSAFLPLSNLKWQSETLKGIAKDLRDQILTERSKMDKDLAAQIVDKILDIDRLTSEIHVQVSDVLKYVSNISEPKIRK